ncbi:hypothetical protein ACHHY8_09845 [Enterobacter cloacae complex sp. 2024EL-00215]|jgi:hypothetical protein|uniref:hypothetical protein n=1 Tax=Enterobacteriaceae TaxID=543 RepID=UPI0015F15A85|nr:MULTISPECIES: hypothetical protein [Enterobacteriaceae]MDU2342824.1 hypothetical protein [Enterobacter asburiae]GJJ99446.1 hypothetical protein TUM16655_28960 [Enterobacter cloacae]HCD7314978.1 hypothetical protein [Enterobacter chengduensis]MBW4225654.1 hypothetical protein [Enterobacter roggenkampii]MBW4244764.1 hypothetical protein [Enterobacter roggenkampii]
MSNIEKIKPQKREAEEKENVRTWQDDLTSQPHLDSDSAIVERQLQRNAPGVNVV